MVIQKLIKILKKDDVEYYYINVPSCIDEPNLLLDNEDKRIMRKLLLVARIDLTRAAISLTHFEKFKKEAKAFERIYLHGIDKFAYNNMGIDERILNGLIPEEYFNQSISIAANDFLVYIYKIYYCIEQLEDILKNTRYSSLLDLIKTSFQNLFPNIDDMRHSFLHLSSRLRRRTGMGMKHNPNLKGVFDCLSDKNQALNYATKDGEISKLFITTETLEKIANIFNGLLKTPECFVEV